MRYRLFPSASFSTPLMGTSCGHNVLWRPSCEWAIPHSSTPTSVSACMPAISGTYAPESSTLLRPGKLKGRGLYTFLYSWSFLVGEQNKREEEEEVAMVFLSGDCWFHATINGRLCFSSALSALPAVADQVSSTDLQVSCDRQWQWRQCLFDVLFWIIP